jgi:hypothetical protein
MQRIARWESKSGKHYVDLFYTGTDYHIQSVDSRAYFRATSDENAIEILSRRVNMYQPDANKTPMHRV